MRHIFTSLFLVFCFLSCNHIAADGEIFSSKWKSSTTEERKELANAEIIYGFLSNKSKDEVVEFLGEPDKIDEFGDYIYSLGRANSNGHEFGLTCLVAFDNGPLVKRIEVTNP